jgi:hypothetical protein
MQFVGDRDPATHSIRGQELAFLANTTLAGCSIQARPFMFAAGELIHVLTRLRSDDREIQAGLQALRIEMTRQWQAGTPWRARDALDVIAALDMPAWAALLALIDDCPVMHAGIRASRGSGTRSVNASALEFISERNQIASVREFMQSLPEMLRGSRTTDP